jgi:hypothetical protein
VSHPLPPALAGKLAKLCGRLASDHGGERAAAGLLASRLLRNAGLTWDDVLRPPRPAPVARCWNPGHPAPTAAPHGHRAAARRALELGGARLTPWEASFLANLEKRRDPPSRRQAAALGGILDRLERQAAGRRH